MLLTPLPWTLYSKIGQKFLWRMKILPATVRMAISVNWKSPTMTTLSFSRWNFSMASSSCRTGITSTSTLMLMMILIRDIPFKESERNSIGVSAAAQVRSTFRMVSSRSGRMILLFEPHLPSPAKGSNGASAGRACRWLWTEVKCRQLYLWHWSTKMGETCYRMIREVWSIL